MKYQITQLGMGFKGRHPLGKLRVLRKLRSRLKRLKMPITIDQPKGPDATRYNLEGAMQYARNHIDNLKSLQRMEFEGDAYDQPKWVIRAIDVQPKAPMVRWLEQYVGRSPYGFAAEGPPGPSDCSGSTRNAARAIYKIDLPHGADLQKNDPHIRIFHDASDLRPDDFMFFNYGRLNWPTADHVELVKDPMVTNIGSRPSTGGVNFYHLQVFDRDNILCFGRLIHD